MATQQERLAALEENQKTVFKRLDGIDEKIDDLTRLTIAVEKIVMKTDAIGEKVSTIDERLGAIESAPVKKWDKIKDKIAAAVISAVIGGFIGFIITKLTGG